MHESLTMADYICPECGYPLNGNEAKCPECGIALNIVDSSYQHQIRNASIPQNQSVINVAVEHKDWANYFYECWIIGWKAFTRMFHYSGRSSRREFWSYYFLTLVLTIIPIIGWIIWALGLLAVSIRRMHDINKSGWNVLIPIWCFFWFLKKSDPHPNRFGKVEPAKNLLD